MPSVTLKAPSLPFLPTRVRDDESRPRTWRHPFRGASSVPRSLTAATTLPTSVVSNVLRQPVVGAPAAIVSAPLLFTAVADSAERTAVVFKSKYPSAVAAVQAQRTRTADRAREEAVKSDAIAGTTRQGTPRPGPSAAALHDQTVLARLERTRQAVNLERWTGPPRTVALAGYGSGQAAASVTATSRLAAHLTPAALPVASVGAIVGGSIALPAQALMTGISGAELVNSARQRRQLRRDTEAVANLEGQAPGTMIENARQVLHRRRQYEAFKMCTSGVNMVGQVSSMTSTACAFSGVGAIASPVLATAGISLVVGSIAASTVAQSKQSKFMGDKAVRPAAERPTHRDVSSRLGQGESIDDVLQVLSADQVSNQERLVTAKLMSLVVHVLDQEDKRGPTRPWLPHEREAAVEKLVRAGGRKGLFVRTSLLPAEREALRDRFYSDLAGSHFFAGSADDVRARVLAALHADPVIDSLSGHDRVRQRVMTRAVRLAQSSSDADIKAAAQLKSGESSRVIDGSAWDSLLTTNVEARRLQKVAESRRLPREAKREAAASRVQLVGDVVDLAHTQRKLDRSARVLDSSLTESQWL